MPLELSLQDFPRFPSIAAALGEIDDGLRRTGIGR
jgi:hypothetical protein